MNNKLLLVVLTVATSACAARPVAPTTPLHYACDEGELVRTGDELTGGAGAVNIRRGWVDDEGSHFVTWPHATTDKTALEVVLPRDVHADATTRMWDTSAGTSQADWRLTGHGSCRVRGGYSDALALFVGGKSMKEVAAQLELDNAIAARHLVREAMNTEHITPSVRYYDSFSASR